VKRSARKTAKRDPLRITRDDILTLRWASRKADEQGYQHGVAGMKADTEGREDDASREGCCALVMYEMRDMIKERLREIARAKRAEKQKGGAS